MEVQCQSCGARLALEANLRTVECPYCATTSVVERSPQADRLAPLFALGFTLGAQQAREKARAWLASRGPFAKTGLHRAALDNVRGVYVPGWLYSAQASSRFAAEIGERYQSTRRERGKTETRTETEWRPLEGAHSEYVLDLLVTASRGLGNEELERIEPFDLRFLRRYDPALLSGWAAEEPSLGQAESLELARGEARALALRRLAQFMPGDAHRALRCSTELSGESLELCLVPVWVMAARLNEKEPPVHIVVNGQTGRTWGKTPLSWPKLAAAALGAAALVAGIVFLVSRLS